MLRDIRIDSGSADFKKRWTCKRTFKPGLLHFHNSQPDLYSDPWDPKFVLIAGQIIIFILILHTESNPDLHTLLFLGSGSALLNKIISNHNGPESRSG